MATITGFQPAAQYQGHNVFWMFARNNAPTSGVYNGAAPAGCLVLNVGAGVLYQNTGTIDATTWAILGSVLPASLNGAALPTADPHSTGSIWANSGVLTVSAG